MNMLLKGFLGVVLISCLTGSITGAQDVPKGHLDPFGGHRPPDVVIDELYEIPEPQRFWDEYVSVEKAAILRGAATRSPGFLRWSEDFLSQEYGDLEVRLEGKHERKSGIPVGEKGLGRDTIRTFLKTFRDKDTYIVSQLPEPMYKDFYIPPCISCGNMRNRVVEIDLWMSSGNTHSIIHKDAFNAINCLMKGTKYWKLIEYKYEKWLYKTWEPKREIGGNSQVDAHRVDLLKYPDIARVRWSNFTINAGDCLFLPKSYYHQVSSYGDPNMAVSVLFSRIPSFDDSGCNETVIDFTPLSDVNVLWSWSGHGEMSMGHLDVWMLKANYLEWAKEKGQMTFKDLLDATMKTFPEFDMATIKHMIEDAWKVLDKTEKGFLSPEDIKSLDTPTLQEHALAFDLLEPSNTEDFEYSYIDAELIEDLLLALAEVYPNGLPRRVFVDEYVKRLEGTEQYANEIFDGLAGEDTDLATREQIVEKIDAALHKWTENRVVDSSPEIDNQFTKEQIKLFKEEL